MVEGDAGRGKAPDEGPGRRSRSSNGPGWEGRPTSGVRRGGGAGNAGFTQRLGQEILRQEDVLKESQSWDTINDHGNSLGFSKDEVEGTGKARRERVDRVEEIQALLRRLEVGG